jgi:hypothetical protein
MLKYCTRNSSTDYTPSSYWRAVVSLSCRDCCLEKMALFCTVLAHVREQHLLHCTNDFDFVIVPASHSCRRSIGSIATSSSSSIVLFLAASFRAVGGVDLPLLSPAVTISTALRSQSLGSRVRQQVQERAIIGIIIHPAQYTDAFRDGGSVFD